MKINKVVFADKILEGRFDELSNKDPIKKALIRAMKVIKERPDTGRRVKIKLIPKKYSHLEVLFIFNLPSAWRMLYTVTAEGEINILSVVLDWMNHKDYDNLFGF